MTEEQRIAELMKPRFLVLEGWPGSENFPFHKGDIIIQNKQGKAWESIHGRNVYFGVNPDMHPHLFKRLEWHEERKQEEMPEYYKYSGNHGVFKTQSRPHGGIVMLDFSPTETMRVRLEFTLPATLTEYQQYINSNQQP